MDSDTPTALKEMAAFFGSNSEPAETEQTQDEVEDAPIVRLANTVLQSAIKERASHVHIEPKKNGLTVSFRIDGVLQEVMQMPNFIVGPLTRRYKYLADVKIFDHRVPQQGCIGSRYAGKEYSLRVNFLPTLNGEKIVIRIADIASPRLGLNELGFTPDMQARVEAVVERRSGLFLMAGASGQGKTTTQYVLLEKLAQSGASVYAVADYYDYPLPGISQAILNNSIGYTAAVALRSIAELDADAVALEQLSNETFSLALDMAGGPLVMGHISAYGALHALRCLQSFGIDPTLVADGLAGLLAQRLVRRICLHCKEDYEVTARVLWPFGYKGTDPTEIVKLARGQGCEACRDTGYKGRIALFELIVMNPEIADAVSRRASHAELEQAVSKSGHVTMREDGLIKVLQGITTLEEVKRTVPM